MTEKTLELVQKNPALGLSMQAEVEPGRTIVLQTHTDQDISSDKLNKMLDVYADALDRQMAKFSKMKLEKQLEMHEKRIVETMELDIVEMKKAEAEYGDSGRRGDFKLHGVKQTQHEQRQATMKKDREEIAKIRELIYDCEKKIAA